jgi:ATP-dependent RNA helicase DBP3
MQSHENLEKAGKTLGIESICIYGGVSKQDQYRELNDNRVKIVVGTPGRVLDLANEGALDLSG